MNKRAENEQLLQDVLAGETEEIIRDASLQHILMLARRRRRRRSLLRVGAVAMVLLTGTLVVIRDLQPKPSKLTSVQSLPPAGGLVWVSNEPLSAMQVVTSRPLLSGQIVTSTPMAAIVHTTWGNFREVGDEELLALAAPQMAAIVRRGPHEAELVFVSAPPTGRDN